MANSEQRIASSDWRLATGEWRMANGKKKLDSRSPFAVHRLPFTIRHSPFTVHRSPFTVFCALFALLARASGQSVLTPPPPEFLPPSSSSSGLPGGGFTELTPEEMAAAPVNAGQSALKWGLSHLRPFALYRLTYGNGLQSGPGNKANTLINEVDTGMSLRINNRWLVSYSPSMRFYSSTNFRDTVDHNASLSGGATYRDWTFGLSQSYSFSSQPLVETAGQTDTETFTTGLNATYKFNSKLSLELGVNQSFRFLNTTNAQTSVPTQNNLQSDTRDWSSMDWLNYQVSPKLGVAIGVGGGYTAAKSSTDMAYEQLQGRLTWKPGQKLSLTLSGGGDERQFIGSSQPSAINPIFSVSLAYQIFEHTSLSLTGSRSVSQSYFQSQVTEGTSLSAGVNQRLFGKVTLSVSGGYHLTTYGSSTKALSVNREDSGTSADARLSCPVFKRGSISVFISESRNSSSQGGYSYTSTQEGLELGYRF